jgi:hypothetical protein
VKSYFLGPICSTSETAKALSELLPGQTNPWLLTDSRGDAIAYFHIANDETSPGQRCIQVDISGRHYNEDTEVLSVLSRLRPRIGGAITNDA